MINIISIIVFIIIGFGLGFLSKAFIDRIKISDLKREKSVALLEKSNMQKQWEKAIHELSQTKVLLNDTLAAIELLRQYQSIDDETKKRMNEIDDTLDPNGNPTEDTYDAFKKLVKDMNKKSEEYNTASISVDYSIREFIELRKEAEKLLKGAISLLFIYKE